MFSHLKKLLDKINEGHIPSLYLIVCLGLPFCLYITISDMLYMRLIQPRYTDPTIFFPDTWQELLAHSVLFPILVVFYWLAIKNIWSRALLIVKLGMQIGLAALFSILVRPMLGVTFMLTEHQLYTHRPFTKWVLNFSTPPLWGTVIIQSLVAYSCGLAVIAGITLVIKFQRERRQVAELDNELLKARLQALRAQINPHFLSNALNTVVALIRPEPDKAERAVVDLHGLLNASLSSASKQIVPMREELGHVTRFVSLMKLRFEDALDMAIDIPEEALDCGVPDFLLINLIENAFKHGGVSESGRFMIRLSVEIRDRELIILVGNLLAKHENKKPGFGIGLRNTEERLSAIYGDSHRLIVGPSPEGLWLAKIGIPLTRVGFL